MKREIIYLNSKGEQITRTCETIRRYKKYVQIIYKDYYIIDGVKSNHIGPTLENISWGNIIKGVERKWKITTS